MPRQTRVTKTASTSSANDHVGRCTCTHPCACVGSSLLIRCARRSLAHSLPSGTSAERIGGFGKPKKVRARVARRRTTPLPHKSLPCFNAVPLPLSRIGVLKHVARLYWVAGRARQPIISLSLSSPGALTLLPPTVFYPHPLPISGSIALTHIHTCHVCAVLDVLRCLRRRCSCSSLESPPSSPTPLTLQL